ncbi:hypothetical protein JEU34_24905, partial [Pseudomonas aeruginosa]|nr:hypothetical protein [Pseudomonas aeruginosa]
LLMGLIMRLGGVYETRGDSLLINDCYVKITARDPESGDIAEPFLWVRSRSAHVYDYNFIDGESLFLDVDHTAYRVSNLNWHLNVTIKDGECRTTSTLRMLRPIRLPNPYERHEHAEFEAYAQVLEKLACGWEPVGYVGLEPGEWSEPEKVLPRVFRSGAKSPKRSLLGLFSAARE